MTGTMREFAARTQKIQLMQLCQFKARLCQPSQHLQSYLPPHVSSWRHIHSFMKAPEVLPNNRYMDSSLTARVISLLREHP